MCKESLTSATEDPPFPLDTVVLQTLHGLKEASPNHLSLSAPLNSAPQLRESQEGAAATSSPCTFKSQPLPPVRDPLATAPPFPPPLFLLCLFFLHTYVHLYVCVCTRVHMCPEQHRT